MLENRIAISMPLPSVKWVQRGVRLGSIKVDTVDRGLGDEDNASRRRSWASSLHELGIIKCDRIGIGGCGLLKKRGMW